ncbi:diguanylate cyclase [candidate division KSB1 bacterium]
MDRLDNIFNIIGDKVSEYLKTTLVLFLVMVFYGFFPIGIDNTSKVVLLWRILTIILFCTVLYSMFKNKTVAEEKEPEEEEKVEESEKDLLLDNSTPNIDLLRQLSGEALIKSDKDTESDYQKHITKLLTIIKKTFAAHSSVIFILDESTKSFYKSFRISESDKFKKDHKLLKGDHLFEKVIVNNKSLLSNFPEEIDNLINYYSEPVDIKSILITPISINEKALGVLIIDSLEKNIYSDDDISLLEHYSSIVAETILNYNNLFEYENSAKLFSFFYEVSLGLISNLKFEEILDLLISVLNNVLKYDRLTISEYRGGSESAKIIRVVGQKNEYPEGTNYPIEEGLNGWIIRKRKSIRIPDIEKEDQFLPRFSSKEKTNYDLRSFIGAPISYHDVCFGAITIESKTPSFYSDRDELILIMLANHFGIALERSHALKQLELQATTDGLTGLYNFRTFTQRIQEEVERSIRYESKFTLLMIDIDHFKKVNDTFGHQAGDKVLTQVAATLKQSTRNVDICCRYGGEEFSIILVETELDKGLPTAERIRENIEKMNTVFNNELIKITASIGVVEFPNSVRDAESLIKEADKALYNAKSSGRNKVIKIVEEESF